MRSGSHRKERNHGIHGKHGNARKGHGGNVQGLPTIGGRCGMMMPVPEIFGRSRTAAYYRMVRRTAQRKPAS